MYVAEATPQRIGERASGVVQRLEGWVDDGSGVGGLCCCLLGYSLASLSCQLSGVAILHCKITTNNR